MSKLICRNVFVQYFGYDPAVNDFSADFSSGFNVILGEGGSGKTTLLKGISGLIAHTGEVLLDDVNLDEIDLKDRDFSLISSDFAVFPHRSVRYNLEYPLKIRKVPKEERRRIVDEVSHLFDLEIMIEAPAKKLNAWHRVALALCRAYIRRPKVLFIDNIFATLDAASRREAFYRFMPLFASFPLVVYATDSLVEAAFLSETIYYLNSGYLMQVGSERDLREKPACAAGFLSFAPLSALLPVKIEERAMDLFGVKVPFDVSRLIAENYIGKECFLGVFPQDFVRSDSGFTAVISGSFYMGDKKVYALKGEGYAFYAALTDDLTVGDEVRLALTAVHCAFDAVNERAIVRY